MPVALPPKKVQMGGVLRESLTGQTITLDPRMISKNFQSHYIAWDKGYKGGTRGDSQSKEGPPFRLPKHVFHDNMSLHS